jgi:hypothetical protein
MPQVASVKGGPVETSEEQPEEKAGEKNGEERRNQGQSAES